MYLDPQKEKFLKYCSTIPQMIRNPLYHWSHLELNRYFGVSDLISAKKKFGKKYPTKQSMNINKLKKILNKV